MSGSFGRTLLTLACILVAMWLVVPTLILIPISFADQASLAFPPKGYSLRWYKNIFENPNWSSSLLNSIQIALAVAVIATIIGTMAALGLERLKPRARGLLKMIIMTPLIIPGVVLAIGIYAVYLDAHLVGTHAGFILAHTLLALPFVVVAVGASLSVFDTRLTLAAASLGASRLTTFRTVTLPLILPGVLSGMLFAFVTSFDEVIVALFITSPQLKTVPVQIYGAMTRESDPTVAALGMLALLVTTVIIGFGLLLGPKKGRR